MPQIVSPERVSWSCGAKNDVLFYMSYMHPSYMVYM